MCGSMFRGMQSYTSTRTEKKVSSKATKANVKKEEEK